MVSDDMRLFFLDVGAVRRALTEIRSMPHSLTAEEWTVEPFEWLKPSHAPFWLLLFCFLRGRPGAVWPFLPGAAGVA